MLLSKPMITALMMAALLCLEAALAGSPTALDSSSAQQEITQKGDYFESALKIVAAREMGQDVMDSILFDPTDPTLQETGCRFSRKRKTRAEGDAFSFSLELFLSRPETSIPVEMVDVREPTKPGLLSVLAKKATSRYQTKKNHEVWATLFHGYFEIPASRLPLSESYSVEIDHGRGNSDTDFRKTSVSFNKGTLEHKYEYAESGEKVCQMIQAKMNNDLTLAPEIEFQRTRVIPANQPCEAAELVQEITCQLIVM